MNYCTECGSQLIVKCNDVGNACEDTFVIAQMEMFDHFCRCCNCFEGELSRAPLDVAVLADKLLTENKELVIKIIEAQKIEEDIDVWATKLGEDVSKA